ncbi:hypothetical protein B0H15DRAFT_955161 [Mycena belliarum]|uniref:Uncharacterized protein n=1 Tax=Mycena belliarum TaxID=1033014 RepID=A0AAD6XKE7_9AGAR|nr:hypothetical protein B0H15DRAFT_955161 [Mycena belliae]
MRGIACLRRPYMALRLRVDSALRLRQKYLPSQLHNSQYGAWFVLDEVQNNRCGGVFAPDRPPTRMRNLFLYPNECPASILRAEKQRTTRADSGICGELACRAYSCFSDFWAAGTATTSCTPFGFVSPPSRVSSAPSPPPWASIGMLLAAPWDRVLINAYRLPLWIPSHSTSISLDSTVRTRGAGFDAGTIGAFPHFMPPLSRQLCGQHSESRPPPPALPDLRDPTAPRSASPRSYPCRRNALVPNGLVCACERGRNTAAALCPPPHFGPTARPLLGESPAAVPSTAGARIDPPQSARPLVIIAIPLISFQS